VLASGVANQVSRNNHTQLVYLNPNQPDHSIIFHQFRSPLRSPYGGVQRTGAEKTYIDHLNWQMDIHNK